MKVLHVGLVIAVALSALILIMCGLNPRPSAVAASLAMPATDPVPLFTRYITIDVEAGAPYADALWSRWQHATIQIPVNAGTSQTITLPGDSQDITASITFGQVTINGTVITFIYSGTASTYYAYRTAQKVQFLGNEYRVDQYSYTNRYFRLISNLSFSSPYQYVGSITFTPQIVTSSTAQWDYVVPESAPYLNVFAASTWLVDPRLPHPDLTIQNAGLSIDSDLNPPLAHLTATVLNSAPVMTSNPAFLQFYSRLWPSTPPTSPIDQAGGWCGSDAAPDCPALATFTNPVPSLEPGQSITLTATYPLTDAGLRDFYLQIDTFGGPLGLNAESPPDENESNNVYSLTRGVPIYYLADVSITGPITGAANVPYSFNAQVVPTTVGSLPLSYTWSPPPDAGQGTSQAAYHWTISGTYSISSTVSHDSSSVIGSYTFTVVGTTIYLPLILKN